MTAAEIAGAIGEFHTSGEHSRAREVLSASTGVDVEFIRTTNLGESIGKQFPARMGQVLAGLPRLAVLTSDSPWDAYVPRVAEIVAYARRLDAVLLFEGGGARSGITHIVGPVGSNLRRSLVSLFPEALDQPVDIDAAGGEIVVDEVSEGSRPTGRLSVDELDAMLRRRGLLLEKSLLFACVSALESGKHLMLTGPPGTGKTSLAEALADLAVAAGVARSRVLVTASADWTSVETVGAYRLQTSGTLSFRAGHVVAAIRSNSWLVVDELNRAEIDKAIGQLFTTLSGQSVSLPFENDAGLSIALVPEGKPPIPDTEVIVVPSSWRLIATMNDRDQDLLFEMSEALIRRFAVVRIDPPTDAEWSEILKSSPLGDVRLDAKLAELARTLTDIRALGPAIILDVAANLRAALRLSPAGLPPGSLRRAIDMFVSPQLAPSELVELLERFTLE